jgi:hypothetical protein
MQRINKFWTLLVLSCLSFVFCLGQKQKKDSRFHFQSINQVGLLNGEKGSALQFQTINGVSRKDWFGGIGIGMDYYHFRSIPVFADLRKTFGRSKNKPFVYADGGISFTWATDKQKYSQDPGDHLSNGLYLDAGAGYQIHISRHNALLLSLGYSYKNVKEYVPLYYYSYLSFMPANFTGGPSGYHDKYNYHLNRLSFKVGWSF